MVQPIETVEEYNTLIETTKNRLIVLDFTAAWCKACLALSPYLLRANYEFPTIIVKKVDVDDLQEIADAYQVSALPTIIFVKNGRICEKIVGNDVDGLYRVIQKHM
jgi:thioredoxin 1